jgi:hypothetical protein
MVNLAAHLRPLFLKEQIQFLGFRLSRPGKRVMVNPVTETI